MKLNYIWFNYTNENDSYTLAYNPAGGGKWIVSLIKNGERIFEEETYDSPHHLHIFQILQKVKNVSPS